MNTLTEPTANSDRVAATGESAAKRKAPRRSRIQRAKALIVAAEGVESIFEDTKARLREILPPSRYREACFSRLLLAAESAANALAVAVTEEVSAPAAE